MLRNKENPLVGPNGPIVQPGLLTWLTLMVHNFVSIGQISTKLVPIDGPGQGLVWYQSTALIKGNHVNSPGWTIGPLGPTSGLSLFLSILIS